VSTVCDQCAVVLVRTAAVHYIESFRLPLLLKLTLRFVADESSSINVMLSHASIKCACHETAQQLRFGVHDTTVRNARRTQSINTDT
jgi:hypothetical protein